MRIGFWTHYFFCLIHVCFEQNCFIPSQFPQIQPLQIWGCFGLYSAKWYIDTHTPNMLIFTPQYLPSCWLIIHFDIYSDSKFFEFLLFVLYKRYSISFQFKTSPQQMMHQMCLVWPSSFCLPTLRRMVCTFLQSEQIKFVSTVFLGLLVTTNHGELLHHFQETDKNRNSQIFGSSCFYNTFALY